MVSHAHRGAERTVAVLQPVVASRADPVPGALRHRDPDAVVHGAVLPVIAASGHREPHGTMAGHPHPRPGGASSVPARGVWPTLVDHGHPDVSRDLRPHGEPRQSAAAARRSRMTRGDHTAPG